MRSLLETVTKQIHESKDPELSYVLNELADNLAECDTVDSGFDYHPSMVIIVKAKNPEECGAKYLVDLDTLKKYATSSNKSIDAAYDQVLYDNKICKEDSAVLMNNVNLEGMYEYILNSPTPQIKQSRAKAIGMLSKDINDLKLNGIKVVKSLKY